MMIVASADKWGRSLEGTMVPGDGLPNNLLRGGVWGVPSMGFGQKATLVLGTNGEDAINRVKFTISRGSWLVEVYHEEDPIFVETLDVENWITFEKVFDFVKASSLTIILTNANQYENNLYIKGTYVGARVSDNNRKDWIALGGDKGASAKGEVVIADPKNMIGGREWVCKPAPDPSFRRPIYAQVSGAPQTVSALGFKTRTPGVLFQISYSLDDLRVEEQYPNLKWIDLPGFHKLVNGRVDVKPFKARHLRLTFSNLHPMLLKEYQSES
jgi:hypothetical protein